MNDLNIDVRALAVANYDAEIKASTKAFIPFDEAWAEVVSLVNRLEIPD